MMSAKYPVHKQHGFTIVELMIATAVLSTILVLATITITGIGRLYYKGINQARIQNSVRTIANDVVQNIQVGSDEVVGPISGTPPTQAYCIGVVRYSYVVGIKIGSQVGTQTYHHVVWRDTTSLGSCSPVDLTQVDPGGNGTELMSPNSRLTQFTIAALPDQPGVYAVNVRAAYGDDDLLDLADLANTTCRGDVGDQFCATARLQTTAVRRLNFN